MRDRRVDGGVDRTAIVTRPDPPDPLRYPIRAVARATGLSVDTLRAWERRYGAVRPARGDRGRSYSDADVARLKALARLVARGHAIGSIATLPESTLLALLDGSPGPIATGAARPPDDHLQPPRRGARPLRPRRHGADAEPVCHGAAGAGAHLRRGAPRAPRRGRTLGIGDAAPRAGAPHSASIRSVLGGLLRAALRPARPPIVVAGVAHDRHELGLLSAALIAATAGYGVVYLGPDLPADEIARTAQNAGARVVLVAATLPPRLSIANRKALQAMARHGQLWIGGPAAATLITAAGSGSVHVPDLGSVEPMLRERHGP